MSLIDGILLTGAHMLQSLLPSNRKFVGLQDEIEYASAIVVARRHTLEGFIVYLLDSSLALIRLEPMKFTA